MIRNRWSSTWICFYMAMVLYETLAADSDYNLLNTDGSFDFRYDNPDSFHESHANRNNFVKGAFGGRNPTTGNIDRTDYTAGARGFRPKGKNIVRKYDLSQKQLGPIGNKDDPYFDPYEDPSYNFQFNTRVYNRKEGANRLGDVKGSYSYLDDVGDKHEVEYIAGKNTGFHVKTPYPDSYPNAYRSLFFKDPRKPYMRGRSFIQRGLDGSYRFAALGPDHRRTEVSDSVGNVRGSYSYKDEKGVLHSVHYIAGPNIGYRVLKNVKGPHLPTIFPFNSQDIVPSDFYEGKESDSDGFAQAASTYVTPKPNKDTSDEFNQISDSSTIRPTIRPAIRPTIRPQNVFDGATDEDEEELFDDLFNSGVKPAPNRPSTIKPSTYRPPIRPRPSQSFTTTNKPQYLGGSQGNRPSFGASGGSSDSSKPSFDGSESSFITGGLQSQANKPQSSKPGFGTASDNNLFGTKPSASTGNIFSTKPSSSEENFFDVGSDEDVFRPTSSTLYGSRPPFSAGPLPQRPRPRPTQPGKPLLQFDLSRAGEGDRYHTIITNYGDTVFTAPPGVPVRAHVQSIGLVPLYPRSPSPSEQYQAELVSRQELDVETAEDSHHVEVPNTASTVSTTSLAAPSTASTLTRTEETTTSNGTTVTTSLPETTTAS